MLLSSCMHFLIQIIFHVTLKEKKKGAEVLHLILMFDAFLNVMQLQNEPVVA